MNWGAIGALTGALGIAFAAGVWTTSSNVSIARLDQRLETVEADVSRLKEVEIQEFRFFDTDPGREAREECFRTTKDSDDYVCVRRGGRRLVSSATSHYVALEARCQARRRS